MAEGRNGYVLEFPGDGGSSFHTALLTVVLHLLGL